MDTVLPPPSLCNHHQDALTSDEISMQQSLLFSDSLKELKNLRSQLYSAAEYFELSFCENREKSIMLKNLKDYTITALLSTVDHLGSISHKIDDLLDEKIDEVSRLDFRVSCIEQRMQICRELVDREGRLQQSLVIQAPKYNKHYILPGSNALESEKHTVAKCQPQESWTAKFQPVSRQHSFRKMCFPPPSPSIQRSRSLSPSRRLHFPSSSQRIGDSLRRTGLDKRAMSPLPTTSNPITYTASLSCMPTVLNPSGITRWYSMDTQNSAAMRLRGERNNQKEMDRSSNKSRSFLKLLLTRRRSRENESLYSYLNEY
ncbi:probable protein ABIL3 [Ananas comosus]|uniref:Probable protein ABIL3 n=1 Tax=Ananas comosus TaxID=4615 RepID=A0A6P5FP30_ANACO|nr:probable protein ABIL3 [Ananas comosus]